MDLVTRALVISNLGHTCSNFNILRDGISDEGRVIRSPGRVTRTS